MKTETVTHTPGPWRFHLGRGASPRLHIQTSAGYQIASGPEVSRHAAEAAEQEANARLIAAAPELLAELRKQIRNTRGDLEAAEELGQETEHLKARIESMRAAISKAEGQA